MTEATDRTDDHSVADRDDRADVVVVGGGPTGSAAAVFTARYGLDTVVLDRGNAALRRCAHLENYPGFPAGIDVETFYALLRDHVETAGCEYVADVVTDVAHLDANDANDGDGGDPRFVVETQDGRRVATRYVVAAAWYDGEYLRGLDDPDAMFDAHAHDGEEHEHFDPDYPDEDGRTPVDGLYVAAPNGERNAQAVVAAGQGAHVARRLIADERHARGFPESVADYFDWLRPESEFQGEWGERDRWRAWIDEQVPDEHGLDEERYVELRERYIDRRFATARSDDEIERLRKESHDRLLEHLDDDRVLARAAAIEAERRAADES